MSHEQDRVLHSLALPKIDGLYIDGISNTRFGNEIAREAKWIGKPGIRLHEDRVAQNLALALGNAMPENLA